jgi:hypothetical protein
MVEPGRGSSGSVFRISFTGVTPATRADPTREPPPALQALEPERL